MRAWRRPAIQIAIIALAMTAAVAPMAPTTVERLFSTGLYPPIQRTLTTLSNLAPFAILDLLSIAACAFVVSVLIRAGRASRRIRRISPVLRALGDLATAAAVAYLAFLMMWGFNYRRIPMMDRLVLAPAPPTLESVLNLGMEAARRLNALHEAAHRAGWTGAPLEDGALRGGFDAAQRALSDASLAAPGRLKRTIFGPYFRWTSVDGMINPFGLEILANPDLLPFERPFVAAHEWAHLAGYADEAEANFVGWLTCLGGDVSSQYSGWLFLYWQVSGEVDDTGRTRLAETLGVGPRSDIEAVAARIRGGELPWLRTAGWRAYDQYLKANRVEEGVRSYSAVVTLIVRARFEQGWRPVRRTVPGA